MQGVSLGYIPVAGEGQVTFADMTGLATGGEFVITPPERTYIVAYEGRIYVVDAEGRTSLVEVEDRSYQVMPEIRKITAVRQA
jgi:hypothetical protein